MSVLQCIFVTNSAPLTLRLAISTGVHVVNLDVWVTRTVVLVSAVPTVAILVADCGLGDALLLIRTLELCAVARLGRRGQLYMMVMVFGGLLDLCGLMLLRINIVKVS